MLKFHEDIDEILLPEEIIQSKIKELAAQVSKDYQNEVLHLITILKGAFIFLADFSRALTIQATLDFMVVSSYEGKGEVRILKDLNHPIHGRHVLIIEDILDQGRTLQTLMKSLIYQNPASLKVCTLLQKPSKQKGGMVSHYNGFTIPDKFVVGYGLDYHEKYRDLPYIATLRKEVYQRF